MSKNITIAEGTQAKNFSNVSKIRVNNIGGGTSNWIPEEEAGLYANLGEANITKNGTYKASDEDYDGFSKVTVKVDPKVTTKTVTKNGTYKAKKDKVDGFSEVSVQVPTGGDATLISKTITENGSYNAGDDNADGYISVNVNVSGGGGGGTLITKSISQNGTYNARDDNADGYSSVTVNVSGGGGGGGISGREMKGTANGDLVQNQTVQVVTGSGTVSEYNSNSQSGWLRESDNCVYRWENNRYNAYDLSGNLVSQGEDTVYGTQILNGGEAVCLTLYNQSGSAPYHAKYKILWNDGTDTTIEFDYQNYTATSNVIGVNNGLIAALHGRADGAHGYSNATVDVFDKQGNRITQNLCYFDVGYAIAAIVPISSNAIAAYHVSQSYTVSQNSLITAGGILRNTNRPTNASYKGYYNGYFYILDSVSSSSNVLKRISINDITSEFEVLSLAPYEMSNINYYGNFTYKATASATTRELYSVDTLSQAYAGSIGGMSSSIGIPPENSTYLIFDKTYVKSNQSIISATNIYPKSSAQGTYLGIMKANCNSGAEGTAIILFS